MTNLQVQPESDTSVVGTVAGASAPEPGTVALILGGLGLVAGRRLAQKSNLWYRHFHIRKSSR